MGHCVSAVCDRLWGVFALDLAALKRACGPNTKGHHMDWDEMARRLAVPLTFTSFFSSMAGLALLLRNQDELRARDYASAVLCSVCAGVIVYLLLLGYLEQRPFLLLGVSCLAGAGGASTLDLLLMLGRRWASSKFKDEKARSDDDAR